MSDTIPEQTLNDLISDLDRFKRTNDEITFFPDYEQVEEGEEYSGHIFVEQTDLEDPGPVPFATTDEEEDAQLICDLLNNHQIIIQALRELVELRNIIAERYNPYE